MRATCPNCDTVYLVSDDQIGEVGRRVRCARCGENWRVFAALSQDDLFNEDKTPLENASRRLAGSDLVARQDFDIAGLTVADAEEQMEQEAKATDSLIEPFDPTSPASQLSTATAKVTASASFSLGTDGAEKGVISKSVDVESVARKPKLRAVKSRRRLFDKPLTLFWVTASRIQPFTGIAVFLAAVALPVVAVIARASVVDAVPNLAGFYQAIGLEVNLRGLKFSQITTLRELENGQQVLVIEGVITNVSNRQRPVPTVRLSLRGDDAQEMYAWSVDPKAQWLAPDANVRFRTRLAAPPEEAREVQLRFIERRSRQAANP